MPKKSVTKDQAKVTSVSPAPGHLQVTVSGPAAHVMAALTKMNFQQPSLSLCQQIALNATGVDNATPANTLGELNMTAPEARNHYVQVCAGQLLTMTGHNIQGSSLPHDESTTVHTVAGAMFDATNA